MFHAVTHAVGVFVHHLAAVEWRWISLALIAHLAKLALVSRAWRNIVRAAYPTTRVRWLRLFGAYVAGTGVNAIIPARGGDAIKLYLAKRRVEGATYTTLVATVLLQTFFDMVVAGAFIVWAISLGALPGLDVLPHLPSLDYGWAFRHPTAGLVLFVLLLVFGGALILWIAERVDDFKAHVAQGFTAFRDRPYYLTRVVPLQVADWTFRLVTVLCFLHAFGVDASLHNVLLVQVSQSLATVLPFSPGGIGTEQAFLLYLFRDVTSRSQALSFSVGMRVTLTVFNAALGFTAIFLMLRTLRFRDAVESDRATRPTGA